MHFETRDRRTEPDCQDEELALVAGLKARDSRAFDVLVRTHGPVMLRVARRMMRSDEDARDAVQDAFVSVVRSIDRFELGSQLSTWLHRIVVNACLMRIRFAKRRPESELDPLLPQFREDGHQQTRPVPWTESAETMMERRETIAMVREAVDRLPDGYREVLILRDIEELSVAETAGLLGLTGNAVKIRTHRARQALRSLLDPMMRGERS